MSVERLSLAQLNAMDRSAFVSQVGWAYEHSAWVAEGAWEDRPFRTIDDLYTAMERVVRSATPQKQLALIQAHPDLAGRFRSASELTVASRREQADAGLNQLTASEAEQMARNNERYREKFGFPFILCARLNNAKSIREALEKRLENSRAKEIDVALGEISKIGRLRLADAIS
jgi:2-oxo-4-hydroxy-4-carboxy-5-ureidoimidazoline decarboxylase